MFKWLSGLKKTSRVQDTPSVVTRPTTTAPKKTGRLVGGALALTVGIVGTFEGLRTTAYLDVVGVPTVCYGETRGVKLGDKYTREQCQEMLGEGLKEFSGKIEKCIKDPWKVPDGAWAAFTSLAYNIGSDGFCKSSVAANANQGNLIGACNSILLYNKGGRPLRVIKGLDNRRKEENKLCLDAVRGK